MKSYFCHCGHEVVAEKTPAPIRWKDGHVCYFDSEQPKRTEWEDKKKED
jgi:hypothetical protein